MLYIRPYTSEDDFPQFAGGLKEGKLYYVALAGKELIGYICYRKKADELFIEEVESGRDADLFDGLMRAVFDAAVNSGMDRAEFSPQVDRGVLETLRVPLDSQNCVNSLSDFLRNCRKCKMF